jgi:putative tricarboxylic transport membrane protein
MNKKRVIAVLLCAVLLGGQIYASGEKDSSRTKTGSWEPSRNIDWVCSSSAGGGSDIFSRIIADIMVKEGFTTATILVTNKSDGGGEVARTQVANTTGVLADHTLMSFNSGDLLSMLRNTENRMKNFKPLSIMAMDKQLLFIGQESKYKNFKEIIDAIKAGKKVVMGAAKGGDDQATFNQLLKELGWDSAQMPYVVFDSSSEAITAILGDHVDVIISKPAAAISYVEAGQLFPILALASERYTGNLSSAPTLSELGNYKNVEVPIWRGVVGPAAMSSEAQAYWSEALKKITETSAWKTNYLDKFKLVSESQAFQKATSYMNKYQDDFLSEQGKK